MEEPRLPVENQQANHAWASRLMTSPAKVSWRLRQSQRVDTTITSGRTRQSTKRRNDVEHEGDGEIDGASKADGDDGGKVEDVLGMMKPNGHAEA